MADSPPVLPPAGDPGIAPDGSPWWIQGLRAIFGGFQPIDALPAASVPAGGGPMVKVPTPTSTDKSGPGSLQGIDTALNNFVAEVHQTVQDVEHGLPIVGTFALLAVVFLAGLVMFLNESGGGEVIAGAAGHVAAIPERRRKREAAHAAERNAVHAARNKRQAAADKA